MSAFVLLVFAYLAGITVSGLSASLLEAGFGARARFAEPFVSRHRVVRSLAITAVAGPVMLFNETLAAWRSAALGPLGMAGVAFVSNVWVLASGILALQLLHSVRHGFL